MKIRNGFVSNSSSSSFVLKNLPENVDTWEDVYDFYGMKNSYYGKRKKDKETVEFCKMILNDWNNRDLNKDSYFFEDYFNDPDGLEKFLNYYDYSFKGGYGMEELKKIFANPENYWLTSVEDTYLGGPGCAIGGDYITENGVEINCH